jgi:hypothetical protein
MFPVFNYRHFFEISCLQILYFLKINGVIFVAFYLLNREIMYTKQLHSIIKFSAIAIILSLVFFQCSSSKKSANQNTKLTGEDVRNMVNNKDFIFVAERVLPFRGSSRLLTSEYDVTVKKDSLISYLPFFGRAYQAPIDPSKGGMQFTSTNFSYEVNANKNNGWDVIIKPKDYHEVQQFSFRIFENGSASLNVINTNKDPISFNGHVEKFKE